MESERGPKISGAEAALKVCDLHLSFAGDKGTLEAVRGVSFELREGEVLALVGASGCGKSVLCKGMLGLLPQSGRVTGGQVLWRGEDLLQCPPRRLRKLRGTQLSYLPQDPAAAFDPTLPVGRQIAEVLCVWQGLSRREGERRAAALLGELGFSQPERWCQSFPHELSGGMLQRAALAAAIACAPKVLIADEPTTALDAPLQRQILDLLRCLQEERGLSVLFVTHDLRAAAYLAQRIAVMVKGQLVELAPAEELFSSARHPYTRALLSAMEAPLADSPLTDGEFGAAGELEEITPGHFVAGPDEEKGEREDGGDTARTGAWQGI